MPQIDGRKALELMQTWGEKLDAMRAMGGTLNDSQFAQYRKLEDESDALTGRIASMLGKRFGPTIDANMGRAERLQARMDYAANTRFEAGFGTRGESAGSATRISNTAEDFESFGHQLRAVIAAGTPGEQTDPRLFTRAASGLNEKVGSEGGFLVQTDFSMRLLERGMSAAKIAPRCSSFPIGDNRNSIDLPAVDETSRVNGSRWGGIQLAWTDEGGEFTASKPKFRKLHLEPKKLTGLIYLTDEIIQDVRVLENFVTKAFSEEFRFVVDDAILRGTGAGQPLGIFSSGGTVEVPKEAGQAANTIVYENVTSMYARLPASSADNAVWFVNQDCMPQLFAMNLKVGTGGAPVFLPSGGSASGRPQNTLLGLPVIQIEQAESVGNSGDIILGDFNRYLLSTRGSLQVASSMHVRFTFGEMVLRLAYRLDGQPELSQPITPYRGAATQSPFIVLETRD